MEQNLEQKRTNLTPVAVLTIAGAAFSAGALAAGAVLMNPKSRSVLKKGMNTAANGVKQVRGAIEEGRRAYQAVSHRISAPKRGRRRKFIA